MLKSNLYDILTNKKAVEILLLLQNLNKEERYVHKISLKLSYTWMSVNDITKLMREDDIVEFDRKGRTNYITLTEKGQKLANYFRKIKKLIGDKK